MATHSKPNHGPHPRPEGATATAAAGAGAAAAAAAAAASDAPEPDDLIRHTSKLSDLGTDTQDEPDPFFSRPEPSPTSSWAHFSLAAALVPAVSGIIFQNGSRIGTDVIIIALAAIFLHWSVTQPWKWYHAAREVRIRHGPYQHPLGDNETDGDDEGGGSEDAADEKREKARRGRENALAELRLHEALALLACFVCPVAGAYLLHAIRARLSQRSEGLVSDFNLTIFVLASELRAFSQVIKLIQSRTIHLQRIVASNPFRAGPPLAARLDALVERLDGLEARVQTSCPRPPRGSSADASRKGWESSIAREVGKLVQPELEVLTRALRRNEKRSIALALQTDARLHALDSKADDAVAIAAAAARHSAPRETVSARAKKYLARAIRSFCNALLEAILFPLKIVLGLFNRRQPETRATARGAKVAKTKRDWAAAPHHHPSGRR